MSLEGAFELIRWHKTEKEPEQIKKQETTCGIALYAHHTHIIHLEWGGGGRQKRRKTTINKYTINQLTRYNCHGNGVLIERKTDGYGFQLHFSLLICYFFLFMLDARSSWNVTAENRRSVSYTRVWMNRSINENIYMYSPNSICYVSCVYISNFNMANEIACLINIVCVCVFFRCRSKRVNADDEWCEWIRIVYYE